MVDAFEMYFISNMLTSNSTEINCESILPCTVYEDCDFVKCVANVDLSKLVMYEVRRELFHLLRLFFLIICF